MATKLPSLITNQTTGEAINYYSNTNRNSNPWFKQEFKVTKNDNYTWTVTSKLYIKIAREFPSGGISIREGLWQRIGNEYFKWQNKITIGLDIYNNPGIWINDNKVSNNPYEYYKIMENSKTYNCSSYGRFASKLDCGYIENSKTYYNGGYTLIYVTFPSFSGMKYKKNNAWKLAMPWIKVNGEWKRVKQYIKVNGEWKEYNDTWIWNPEA